MQYSERTMTDEGQLATTLKVLRGGRGLSVRELADKADVAIGTVHNVEAAKHSPRLATLRRLADALDVSVGTLIEGGNDGR